MQNHNKKGAANVMTTPSKYKNNLTMNGKYTKRYELI